MNDMFETVALKLVEELGGAIKAPIIIDDVNNQVIASANLKGQLPTAAERSQESWLRKDLTYNRKKIGAVWIYGRTEETRIYLNLLVKLFQQNYRKRRNSRRYLKEETLQLILSRGCDSTSISELLVKAGIELGRSQYVFALETKESEAGQVVPMLRKMWAGENAYAIEMTDTISAFLIDSQVIEESADDLAGMLHQLILDELYVECRIGFSSPAEDTNMLPVKFTESMEALKLMKHFKLPLNVANYNEMSLYVLLKSIPNSTLTQISELFRHQWQLLVEDRELLFTLQKYLDYNLNVSEAARSLYIHRNTLLYRLGKLQKLTGLDYRNFDDMAFLRLLMLINESAG